MKRHLKVSLAAVALSVTAASLLTGCGTNTDLENKVDSNQTELQASLRDAIKKAETDLATAKTELQNLVRDGDNSTAQQLNNAINTLNSAIEAAKQVASNSDASLKTELEAAINAAKLSVIDAAAVSLNTAKQELEESIVKGDLATAETINNVVQNLAEAIQLAENTASGADAALKEELLAAIEAVKQDAADAVADKIDEKTAALREVVSAGDVANQTALAEAVESLTGAIELAKALSTTADEAMRIELVEAINASKQEATDAISQSVELLRKDLEAKLAASEEQADIDLQTAVANLSVSIEYASKLAETSDAVLKEELLSAIDTFKVETHALITEAVEKIAAQLREEIAAGDLQSYENLEAAMKTMISLSLEVKAFATDADATLKADLETAIATAKAELAEAFAAKYEELVDEFEAKLADNEATSTRELTAAVEALNAAVEGAKTFATDADVALKAEIDAALAEAQEKAAVALRAAVDEAVEALSVKIQAGDADMATQLATAVEELTALVNGVEAAAQASNDELRDELMASVDAAKAEFATSLESAIKDLKDELTSAIADSSKADADALADAKADFDIAIEAAKKFASDADAALKSELEATIGSAKLEVLDTMETKLATLKTEIEASVKDFGTSVDAKLAELTTALETAKTLFTDADAALKQELTDFVNTIKTEILDFVTTQLADAKTELLAKVEEGDKNNALALSEAKIQLENTIADIKSLYDGLRKQDEEFHAKFDALNNEIKASIQAVHDAGMKLADWQAATDSLVGKDGGLAKLENAYGEYLAKQNTYIAGDFEKVEDLYTEYWVRMIRATSVEEIATILTGFDAEASKVRTIPDAIYDAIMEVGKSVDDVEYDADKEGLDQVKFLLDQAALLGNADVNANIASYGENKIDLLQLYESYVEQYNALLRKSDGQGIKDRMDAVTANQIVWDDGSTATSIKFVLASIRADYNEWISDAHNSLSNVEGFAESYAKFVEAESRYAALLAAKVEADGINVNIEKLVGIINESGATIQNRDQLNALTERIESWIDTYFSGDYAVEIGVSDNYKLFNEAAYDELVDLFDAKVEAFKKVVAKFAAAVDAIGEVNLMSWDEINNALTEYGDLVISRDLNDYNYMFNDSDTPSDYYEILITKFAEYRTLKASALADYNTALEAVKGITVTIYDAEKVQGILDWYATYGVKAADGSYTFDNGEFGTGYILSSSLTVDADDYAEIVELKDAYDTLVAAKNAEVAGLVNRIDAIGTVTFGRGAYIRAIRADYVKYLAGTNAPAGFDAAQFAVDEAKTGYEITNYDALVEAESELAALERMVANTKTFIATLEARTGYSDYTDSADRDSYDRFSKTVQGMIEQFKEANGGSLENAFTDAEIAKVTAARLSVVKYDYTVLVNEMVERNISFVYEHKIPDIDKDAIVTAMNAVKTTTANAIDAATDADAIVALKDLAEVKLAEMFKCVQAYDEYRSYVVSDETLDAAAKAGIELRMGLALETTLNRVVASDNIDDVQQHAKFIRSELESLYSIQK